MHVDVVNSVVINRPVADVSQYAADADNAPLWYVNIKSVEWRTPRPCRSDLKSISSRASWGAGWRTPTKLSSSCLADV